MATLASEAPVRKFSAGRVFERAFSTIRANPAVTLGLALLVGALPGLLMSYLTTLATTQLQGDGDAFVLGFSAMMILSVVFSLAITAFVQGVLTRATVAHSEGRAAGFGECIRAALAVFLPLVGLSLILAIAVGFGLLLLIVPGVMLYVAWSVAAPALVEERRGVLASFGRSNELTKGARWKIFGVLLVLVVVYYLVNAAAAALVFWGIGASAAGLGPDFPISYIIVTVFVSTLMNAFWGTVQAAIFVELRKWKDGFGTEALEEVFA